MPIPNLTAEGRLTADPEMRFTPQGKAVASFTLACSDRKKQGEEWVDGDKCFLKVTVWDKLAENVAESLSKGDECIIVGKLSQREYETREGEKRTSYQEVTAFTVAPSLKWKSATIHKTERGSSGGTAPSGTNQDPWAGASGDDSQPPF